NSALGTVYEINGKNSIVIFLSNSTDETKIYSLGESPESQIVESGINALPYPVEVYDINGRVITTYRQNAPAVKIIRMSDGSVNKILN
ncbi:MAG: hypothetical protein K2G05_03135, partial [Duncaniella sp.]|nr:hypothetical protein [Duncaniella sp.]